MFVCKTALQIYIIHLDGHGTVEYLTRERESRLVHVDSTDNDEVLGDSQALAIISFKIFLPFRIINKQLVYQAHIGFRWLIINDWVSYNSIAF